MAGLAKKYEAQQDYVKKCIIVGETEDAVAKTCLVSSAGTN
jgi:hypothetical protein